VTIDHLGGTPVYVQLTEILRQRIASGELEPDRPLPSLVALVQEYGVDRTQVRAHPRRRGPGPDRAGPRGVRRQAAVALAPLFAFYTQTW
jgi:hypothetical protein